MSPIHKILFTKNGRRFFVKDINKDLHTEYGFIKNRELKKAKDGEVLKSNTNKEFFIFPPTFIDLHSKIKRGAQIIPLKDIGLIIAETGINKESRILDAGSGSGALACLLGSIAKEVITYEIREDFIKIVASNIEFLGLGNIKLKNKDIYKEIDEKDIDVVTLDLSEPWKAIENCSIALKPGGFLASYNLTIPQVMDFVNSIKKNKDFVYLKTSEIIEREWEVEERKVRPKSKGIGHSGFLSFARKVTNWKFKKPTEKLMREVDKEFNLGS
ncbi:methyltransferase domain-containing protein [Candidatus Woesearchaeota archaeon]|nr:methyltransferase domain-containing protein [Candidatus Woesearchaeota archaeon]